MRRKRTVKSTRYRSAGVGFLLMISTVTALAVVADEWRHSVRGVNVEIEGNNITSARDIKKLTGVTDSSNLASLDLLEIRRSVKSNPFVKNADVTRDPPGTLRVTVFERTPIAMLLNVNGCDWLLDADGFVLPSVHAAAIHDLPVITDSPDLPEMELGVRIVDQKVQKALQILKVAEAIDPAISVLFSEICLRQQRDLILYTQECGVPVIFGNPKSVGDKLRSFKAFWDNVAMTFDPCTLEYIDLRFHEQVIIRRRGENDRQLMAALDEISVDSTEADVTSVEMEMDTTETTE